MRRDAYAKINLILDVLDKREDGYHNIDFLMTTIDLYDEVYLEEIDKNCDEIEVFILDENKNEVYLEQLSNEKNLAYLSLKLMKDKFNIKRNYKIKIIKNIPLAAGMAGGSTDAAAVLHLVNDIEHLELTLKQLAEIGIELGSDIYFCVYSKLSQVSGKGDLLKTVNKILPKTKVLVINPRKELSTKIVYENYIFNKEKAVGKKRIDEILELTHYEDFYGSLRNDLEEVSRKLEPEINKLEQFILNLNIEVTKIIVSGSGPTLLVFSNDDSLSDIKYALKEKEEYENYYINIHNVMY